MKRLSRSEVQQARNDVNEFPPNTVGRQQADFLKSNEASHRSLDARIAAAVADGDAAPLWRGPRIDLNAARAVAHERIRKENATKQNQ